LSECLFYFTCQMKIAMVGCGAVGSYYGAMLSRAGREVHFLLRSDYDVVRHHGVRIQSPTGDFVARPQCANAPEAIGPSDVIFIALKTTANAEFARLLPPLVGPTTAIVTLQNGLGNEEQLAELFPAEQILGGLCFVCLNRISPGVIQHLDHGTIVLGEHQRYPAPRTHDLAAMLRHAGIPCKVSDNLARAHWEKLIWNVPFNGLGVAGAAGYEAFTVPSSEVQVPHTIGGCLTTDKLLADPHWEQLVRELMHEVIATANALNLGVDASLAEKQIERTRSMGTYQASTLLDFEQGRPLELESLFFKPLHQAQQAGVPTPRLEVLCELLQQLDARRLSAAS
jgi:2-dehydropantoate 2-reductase